MKPKKKTAKTRVSSITIGRLYNLGNYEHVRYELTVDIPEGESAKQALERLMFILNIANPKPPVEQYTYDHAKKILEAPEEWFKNITDAKERKKKIREAVKDAKDKVKRYDCWRCRRKLGLELMDDFGVAITHKDHKEDWQDDDYEF